MRKVTLLFAVLLSLVGVTRSWAQDAITVYGDADYSSDYVPFDGYDADAAQQDQMIFPASVLTALEGKIIKSMTFYYKKNETSGTNVGNWIVSLGSTTATTLTALDTTTPLTQVYSGAITPNTDAKTITVTFDEGYAYDGGNLLVEFNHPTASGYKKFTFWCSYITPAPAYSKGATRTYLPKTTFTHEEGTGGGGGPALVVKDGLKLTSPYAYSFGLTTAGTTKTFTLSNPGSEATPISVTTTGGFGATISDNATSIAAGGEVTLTISMADATADGTVTVSSTADGIDDFVFNVSGTIKDPSKMWCDFSEGLPAGWTNSGNWTISTSGADGETSGAGYASSTTYGSNKLMYSPLVTLAEGEKLYLMIKGYGATASWNKLTIQYSADGTTWHDAKALTSITNTWQSLEVSEIPAGNWYIGFYGSYVYFTDIYGGTESTAPVIALDKTSYDFGLISDTALSDTITITNTGKSALTGLNIISGNPMFTVAVVDDATSIAAEGGVAKFIVTMASTTAGAQSSTITIKSDNADDLTFTATGAVAKAGTTTALFNDATLAGWTKAGNTSFDSDETAAYFYYSTNTLTSPKVTFVADDFLSVKAKMASSYGYVTVQGSVDGTTFTDIKKLDSSVLNQTDYTTAIVTGISTEYKYLRLNGYYCYVQEVGGLTYAPVLAVMDEAGSAQTSGLTYAFGEMSADQMVTYNFTNAGAGTINITNVVSDNAVFTTNYTEATTAPFALTITANYDSEKAGEQNGKVTVTTSEGTFEINLTSTFLGASQPKFAILVGETEQATGADLGFGIITANTTKEFVIKNDGTGALNVTGIALPDADYTTDLAAAPSAESPLVIAAGESKTVKVTLAASSKSIKSDKNVVISAEGFDDFTFMADATVMPDAMVVDFNDNALPTGWTNASWTIANGAATGKSKTAYLTTPKLQVAEGDFIIISTKAADSYTGNFLTVQTSSDNGATFSDLKKIEFPANSNTAYTSYVVSDIPTTTNKIRFIGYYAVIDEIAGLTPDANDPRMGVYTDAECTKAAAFSLTTDFGFVTEDATVTYYIKNDGTGTMELEQDEVPAGFSAVLGKNKLAAGENTTLTITFGQISGGYRAGDIVVDAGDAGKFSVSVSGVMIDNTKLNLDFATANIPSTWTANNWTKNANGYVEAGYSSTTMETGVLTATAGEQLVIVAKNTYASSSYTFGVKYKKTDAEEWSTLIAAANLGTAWKTLVATIEEAGDYLFQFTGNYTQIQHIYGLTEPSEPVMVVYDGASKAAATYSFGNVANDADATHTFTVKNEGKSVLAGLSAALTGEQADHYSVAISGLTEGGVAPNAEATVTVTQKKDNLGAHAATLTISSTSEGIADFVVALSGVTRDASKLYVDFEDGNVPEGWTNSGWSTSSKYASAGYSSVTLTTPALAVAVGETLSFDARKQYSDGTLTVRYTTDGGVNWTEQNYTRNFTNSEFSTLTLDLENEDAAIVIVQFVGRYVYLDNISGFAPTTAPVLALTEDGSAVATGATKEFGTLTSEAGVATYTLANTGSAAMVTTVATTGVAIATISGAGEGVTIDENTVTLAAGKSATITLTLPYEAPFGEKTGAMTLTSEGWVGDVTVNYTATTLDPTAFYVDFANNAKPAGWYNSGFSFTNANATINSSTEATLITEKLTVAGADDVLTYDAAKTSSYVTSALEVCYSTDRQNWIPVETQPTLNGTTLSTFEVKGLEAGDYYLQFKGKYVTVDNLAGWHKTTAPAHDLFLVSIDVPEGSYIPGSEYTATVKVANLRAASETVSAELYIKNEKADELTEQTIALDETKTFELKGIVPEEGKHLVWVKVFNSDVEISTESTPATIASEHNLSLEIADFALTSEAEVTADDANQFTATFDVKVKNTGSRELSAEEVSVSIVDAEGTPYATKAAAEALAVDAETTIAVTVTTSALEGGVFTFKAQENCMGTVFATAQTVTVAAAAPKLELALKSGEVLNDGDAVAFGLVTEATTKTYTITNSGTRALELVSITAPEGFEVTALTDETKTIAAGSTLDFDVTLKADQDVVSGNLVITYKVDASTNKTFTLALSGRSLKEGTWTEDFAAGSLPTGWVATTWTVDTFSSYVNKTTMALAPSGSSAGTLITPCLTASEGEVLTWDAYFNWYDEPMTVEYSADNQQTWTKIYDAYKAESDFGSTRNTTKAMSFTAPADGDYYLRFTSTYQNGVDNFAGFKLNLPDHIMAITASNIPTSGSYSPTMKEGVSFRATVSLKESRGVDEENVVAKLYMDDEVIGTAEAVTVDANSTKQITIVATPAKGAAEGAQMHIEVEWAGTTLSTEAVTRYVSARVTLALTETEEQEITTGYSAVYDEVTLTRSFVQGWNTFVAPVAVSLSEFGEGAEAYSFTEFADGMLNFSKVTSGTLSVATPYVIYVPEAMASKTFTWQTPIIYSSYVGEDNIRTSQNGVTFQGSYAPIAAPGMEGKYGVTKDGHIQKGSANASMKGFRAYFSLPEGVEVKALRFDGGADGVRTISVQEAGDQLFDINGRKVSKTQRGVYVVNGKTVVVK